MSVSFYFDRVSDLIFDINNHLNQHYDQTNLSMLMV
jgi:hypothetical protein